MTAASGWARSVWLTGGAAAMGLGIWAMHFTGMLAYHLPMVVSYHIPTDRKPIVLGSLAKGAAIASMHYIGDGGDASGRACRLPS